MHSPWHGKVEVFPESSAPVRPAWLVSRTPGKRSADITGPSALAQLTHTNGSTSLCVFVSFHQKKLLGQR